MRMRRLTKDPNAHVIHAPGKRLLRDLRLRFVREHAAGGGRRSVNAQLSMPSFLDVLLVTVLFLLTSFSASAECPERTGSLPWAHNVEDLLDAPMVSVHRGTIQVDGVAAGATRDIVSSGRLTRIDDLGRILAEKRALWHAVQPKKPFPGIVVLQIDQDVPALVVKSVFDTAVHAGYPNVSFMVRKLPPG